VGALLGSNSSSIIIHSTFFVADSSNVGLTGSTTSVTLGGAIYVGTVASVDVNATQFESITSVGSGGGLYIVNTTSASIQDSGFGSIAVTISGGV
jgi:hypothetical protein